MRVAIHQPNYAPWCGYFAKMRSCDLFIFLDDVQMVKGGYVARSQVRTWQGAGWLSVPARHHLHDLIRDVPFADGKWPRRHLSTLQAHYARAPFFAEVLALLRPLYEAPGELLAPFNERLIRAVAAYLGLSCRFARSSDLATSGQGDERLIALCQAVGGTTYVSGKGGLNYQDPARFARSEIALEVRSYVPIPYDQGQDGFLPGLSILDALFHLGRGAVQLLEYRSA